MRIFILISSIFLVSSVWAQADDRAIYDEMEQQGLEIITHLEQPGASLVVAKVLKELKRNKVHVETLIHRTISNREEKCTYKKILRVARDPVDAKALVEEDEILIEMSVYWNESGVLSEKYSCEQKD